VTILLAVAFVLAVPILLKGLDTLVRRWICRRRGHLWDSSGLRFICGRCGHRA